MKTARRVRDGNFYRCSKCGQLVDKRELSDVIFHETDHKPNPTYSQDQRGAHSNAGQINSRFFEIVLMLGRFGHIACRIIKRDHPQAATQGDSID